MTKNSYDRRVKYWILDFQIVSKSIYILKHILRLADHKT